jgi:nucleoside-diphosphate-sugar epimerase
MRYLITGGTGFIGSRLALRCLALGHEVRVLGQENTPAEAENRREVEEAGAQVALASLSDRDAVATSVRDVDVVIHLAAAQHEMDVPDEHFRSVNVEGTANLLNAAAAAGVKRFVYGSTIGVYGIPSGLLDEASPTRPDNIYGVTKLEAESSVLSAGARLPVVVIRIPEVYGPGDRRLLKLFRMIDQRTFFHIGNGRNLHHLIYIDDLLDGILAAGSEPSAEGEVLLLAGAEPVTTNVMVQEVAAALGRPNPRVRAPLWLFSLLATLLELTLRPLGIQPPLHRRRLDFFRKSFALSSAKATARIGFRPKVGVREGMARTAQWYRDTGKL